MNAISCWLETVSELRPLFPPAGGSYKKIGYYDMTKGNLSWYGNDRWIGKDAFVSLITHIWSCLSLSVTFSSALNPLARNHSLHYSRRAPPHLSHRRCLASQAPPPPENQSACDRLLRGVNQSVSQILFSIPSVRAGALRELWAAQQKQTNEWH